MDICPWKRERKCNNYCRTDPQIRKPLPEPNSDKLPGWCGIAEGAVIGSVAPEAPAVSSGRVVGFDVRKEGDGAKATFIASGAEWSSYELYRIENGYRVLVDSGKAGNDMLHAVVDPNGTLDTSYYLKLKDSRFRVASVHYSPEGTGSKIVGGDPVCPL